MAILTRMTVNRRPVVGGGVLAWMIGGAAVGVFAADQPLADAARHADWGVVRALVEQGADVTARQGDGATALHWAAYWDEVELADLLIRAGADVNAGNDLGVTPLWAASENRSAAMVRRLLDAEANPNAPLLLPEQCVCRHAGRLSRSSMTAARWLKWQDHRHPEPRDRSWQHSRPPAHCPPAGAGV